MVALVQVSDTGVYTGNTTGIGSGVTSQILANNTGIGHCVVLMIQSLSLTPNDVTAVTSGMGTFVRVNSYAYQTLAAEDEIWVCLSTTGAAKTVTVTCNSHAWQACAIEYDTPATGALDGGQNYQASANPETITVLPLAAGNLVVIFQDSVNNFVDPPVSPWSIFATGVYWNTVTNGTSAAWQVAPSTAALSANWPTGGLEALTTAALIEFTAPIVQGSITAVRLPF
jgi:hypothetical protein